MEAHDDRLLEIVGRHGHAALAALDEVQERGAYSADRVADAARALTLLRDELIARHRTGVERTGWLDDVNALLSMVFGIEFPVNGLQWRRVRQAREALREMLTDTPAVH